MDKLTDVELKALAYDRLALIEQANNEVKAINTELYNRSQKQPVVQGPIVEEQPVIEEKEA